MSGRRALDDISSGWSVLAVARQFADRDGKHLLVMIAANDATEFARRAYEVGELLAADGMEAECLPLASGAGYQRLLENLPCEIVLAG